MESYKKLNKKEILSRWYEYVDLLDREWTMTPDGDIIKIPNDEIAKAYCKVLLGIYKQIEPFADEIRRDYEAIKDKNLHDIQANIDWDFLRVGARIPDYYRESKSLIDAFHLEDSVLQAVDNIVIPIEHKSDFVFLFEGSEHRAKLFINELNMSLRRVQKIKPEDVAAAYIKFNGKRERSFVTTLIDVIGTKCVINGKVHGERGLGLYTMSYQALTNVFRVKC